MNHKSRKQKLTKVFMGKVLLNILLLLTLSTFVKDNAIGQSLDKLEAERLNIIRDIEKTSALLETYKANKASIIKRFNTLEVQAENSEKLISTLKKEIEIISNQKKDTTTVRYSFDKSNLNKLLAEAYKKRISNSEDAQSNAIREIYIRQLSSYSGTSSLMDSTSILLLDKKEMLNKEEFILSSLKHEIDSLSFTLKETIISESHLEKTYSQKVADRKKLNDKIQNLLFNNFGNSNSTFSQTGTSIENKKGFLKWPVNEGKIELRYGEQKLKENNSLVFVNTGIDITSPKKNVLAIYAGEVITVSNISSDNITMIIKHADDYYTVYSNLLQNARQKGDYVNEGETIGELNKNAKGIYQIHFEIWHSKENLNPYHWLKNN